MTRSVGACAPLSETTMRGLRPRRRIAGAWCLATAIGAMIAVSAATASGFELTGRATGEGVELRWTRGPAGTTGYAIQLYQPTEGWRETARVGAQILRHVATGATPQPVYCYRVEAAGAAGRKTHSAVVCVPIVPEPTLNPQSVVTIKVGNEAELRDAARRSQQADVRILIDRPIELKDNGIAFHSDRYGVLIEGTTPAAGLRFSWRRADKGNWDSGAARNGLEFRNRESIVRNLRISGYEGAGSALKHNGGGDRSQPSQFTVVNCRFEDIGTISHPFRDNMSVARVNTDVWYTNAIASHAEATRTWIVGCTFLRCCTNSFYGHCLYLTTREVMVVNNQFVDCGHAIVAGGPAGDEFNLVVGNEIKGTRPEIDRNGRPAPPYFVGLSQKPQMIAFNRLAGEFRSMFRLDSAADLRRHHVNYNDYRSVAYGDWSGPTDRMNPAEWQRAGFDRESLLPQ